ncbi:hypothetical protein [Capillimicrobium parvum]|uniref:Uncharacterized protein n=1 Tax=Capillimicrobium parvum TaxID=2884022 RepID=A0A9E7BZ77_9ACTN|nr:hypothetical protein [Capillimicrobium parvum]UGS34108.1 hypothetical protein DSM104329_00479 [Capillimicrobium parvum]
MGKRNRQRSRERLSAPATSYEHAEFGVLELRGALTPRTRAEYAAIGGVREDAWQRQVEFLFERLAVRWTIHDLPIDRQQELLARFRAGSSDERAWMRTVLRDHLAENFPELSAP